MYRFEENLSLDKCYFQTSFSKNAKESIHTFIKENVGMSSQEIAIIFDVSVRTIQRIKKELSQQ